MAETALITGASSGIGEEFARQLAARGYDVVLVARRESRLYGLAESLPTTAHVVVCDLASEAPELYGKVEKLGVQVDLLVNNAGFGLRGRFSDLPLERQAEIVRVNCEAVVTLTGAFLPGMLERNRGGDHHGRLHRRHAAPALRGGLRRLEGLRAQLHRGAPRRAARHRTSRRSRSTPAPSRPSGSRSPATRPSAAR